MVVSDRKLIYMVALDERSILQRLINASGEPYSVILIDGSEYLSTPSTEEQKMLDYYKENRELFYSTIERKEYYCREW